MSTMQAEPATLETRRTMREIRLRWSQGIHEGGRGLWMPDNPDNRATLQIVMEVGIETYGDGTHWIEERDA